MNPITVVFAWRLKRRFDRWLDAPEAYSAAVTKQSAAYPAPEWDMVPFVFPVLAYAALARRRVAARPRDIERMAALVRLAIQSTTQQVNPPDGDLITLGDYGRQAVYLGLLNLALSAFLWATGDRRFEPLHGHLCRLLHGALQGSRGGPLWSFPNISWPFDSLSAVLSLRLRDVAEHTHLYEETICAHLDWIAGEGCDPKTRLPWSMVPMAEGGFSHQPPRGCALSLTIAWLWPIKPALSRTFYDHFLRHYWQHTGPLAGFREWAKGRKAGEDLDSGPVVAGYGAAATGFGLATTQVAGDWWRSAILSVEFLTGMVGIRACALWQTWFHPSKPFAVGAIRFHPDYLTGFLFGDACLFMTITWRHLARARRSARS